MRASGGVSGAPGARAPGTDKPYLLVDCYVDEAGAAPAFLPLFQGRRAEVVRAAHDRLPGGLPAGVDRYAGLVLTGSAASVLAGIPWVERVLAAIRAAATARVPMFGVCFGHQAIAYALAGPAAVRKARQPEIGWKQIEVLHDDPLLAGAGPRFTTFLSHEDEVVDGAVRGAGLTVLARSQQCAVQSLRVPGQPVWGVQFHAELPAQDTSELCHSRAQRHPELKLDPQALLREAVDSSALARTVFGNFFRLAERFAPGADGAGAPA